MTGHADRQRQCAFRATRLGRLDRTTQRLGVTRDHDLPRRVEIDGFGNLVARGLATGLDQGCVIKADDGRHAALAIGHRIAHDLASKAHQLYRFRELQHASRDQGGEFTQTVPCHPSWISTAHRPPDAPGRDTGNQHQRLGDFGECELLCGALLREIP